MHGRPAAPPDRERDIAAYLAQQPTRAASRRLALWEIDGGMQCSIIGTCLGDNDLIAVIRKSKLQVARDAKSYDIHSYCVHAASKSSPFSRALTKLLDRRFAGAIRLIDKADTESEMRAAWERMRDSGQIAGGYWAIMSHAHVPGPMKLRVFGEVHMLSHLNGHGANQLALRLAEAERKIADLETRLKRTEQAKLEALAERDAAKSGLAAAAVRGPANVTALSSALRSGDSKARADQRLAKCTRALVIARARARHAEDTITQLSSRSTTSRPAAVPEQAPPADVSAPAAEPALPRRILYIGGRAAVVPHLREVAEAREANFLHHDGGIEDSLHRIEEMIEGCDAVVCPIDCISHGACRMAKSLCQRLNKRFLPIPTSSRSGFERALEQLSRVPAPAHGRGTVAGVLS